jgi:CPA2 family monovalent cation:H+ antiporter-2
MAAPIDLSAFKETLIVLAAAGVVIPVFRRMRIAPVLGFIFVGMAIGPFGLGALTGQAPWLDPFVMTDTKEIAPLAELGVALLLFMIGLEMSFERLTMMRKIVFGLGAAQVSLSALAIAVVAYLFVDDVPAAVTLGLALSLSSTAIIVQVLSDAKQLTKPAGRASFGVLLFQDIAVVPILFAIGVLGAQGAQGGPVDWARFGAALLQAAFAVAVLVALGRVALRPLFRMVASGGGSDSFMAACLLVIVASSIAMAMAGLSMAMGALIAGLLLAETEYRRQIEVTIEPFKGLLLGVFLLSIGMSIDLPLILAAPLLFLAAALGLIAAKALIVMGLGPFFGLRPGVALQTGLLLGPGSEFTFVIVGVASASALIDPASGKFTLALAALTMVLIPSLRRLGQWSDRRIDPALTAELNIMPERANADDAPRVLICGFGRVGQVVAAMLTKHAIPFLAIDGDTKQVSRARARGAPVAWGDASNLDFLRRCDIANARALVVTIDAPGKAQDIVAAARQENPGLIIVCRARDGRHAAELYRKGATDAVPETTEASLVLCEQLLVDLGVPMGYVIASVHDKRAEIRAEIQAGAPDAQVRGSRLQRIRSTSPKEVE